MFKSLAVVSLVASVVVAESLSARGVTVVCSTFLKALNSDTSIQNCLAPFVTATAAFGPGGSASVDKNSVTSALGALCSTSSACDATIRGKLADFYAACPDELKSDNVEALAMYDALYILIPFKNAACSKNDNGDYCVTQEIKSTGTGLSATDIQKYLYSESTPAKRAVDAVVAVNTSTIATTNLPFLFLQPSLSADALCVTCTKNVLMSYITFETSIQYAPGISASPLISGQTELVAAVKTTCPASFMSKDVQAVGGLSGGILNGATTSSVSFVAVSLIAVGVAALL